MDLLGKGIHFNATKASDKQHPPGSGEQKLAACLTSTKGLKEGPLTELYLQYVKGIENRSAQTIWNWWSTGNIPS